MVIAQWLERGLGQVFAPDSNYQEQPDRMDTRSELWTFMAPDPKFEYQPSVRGPPPRAFASTKSRLLDFADQDQEEASSSTPQTAAPTTIFLSPTPSKKPPPSSSRNSSNSRSSSQKRTPHQPATLEADDSERAITARTAVEDQILMASRDTLWMVQRNATFREQASQLLKYCSSSNPLQEKALANMEKLLQLNARRLEATQHAEPNLLTQARSIHLGNVCPDGMTPLMATAKVNQVKAATLLLRYASSSSQEEEQTGAGGTTTTPTITTRDLMLSQTNLFGQTALHIAASFGQVDMVEFLQKQLEGGGEPSGDDGAEEMMTMSTPQQQSQSTPFSSPPPPEDMTGRSAWGAAMTSPNPKARKNRQRLDQILSSSSSSAKKSASTTTKKTRRTKSKKTPLTAPPRQLQLEQDEAAAAAPVHAAPALNLQYVTAHLDGQRVWNEDAILCAPLTGVSSNKSNHDDDDNAMLFLVCDGHGDCGSVAHFVAQHLPDRLAAAAAEKDDTAMKDTDEPTTKRENDDETYWTRICQSAALQLDQDLKQAHLAGGSTAVWAIVTSTHIVVANVGDSRCILLQQTTTGGNGDHQQQEEDEQHVDIVEMSHDHKPDLPAEQERIQRAGLTVVQESYVPTAADGSTTTTTPTTTTIAKVQLSEMNQLGVSRAFGDFEYKASDKVQDARDQAVTPLADVQVHIRDVQRDAYLLLACDGIWDVQSNQDVADFVISQRTSSLATTAEDLVQHCLHSGDNLSLILVAFGDSKTTRSSSSRASLDPLLTTPDLSRLSITESNDETPDLPAVKALVFSPEKGQPQQQQ